MQKKSNDLMGKALFLSLILIVVDLIGGFAHLRFETWFKWLSAIVLVGVLIIFCIQFAKQQNEGVTFGKVFGYGFRISALVAVLMVIYTLLSIYVIFPEFINEVLEKSRADMEAKGGISQDTIEQALTMTKKFFLPFAIIGTVIFTLLVGCIGSLLGAAFAKKGEPNVFQNNQ